MAQGHKPQNKPTEKKMPTRKKTTGSLVGRGAHGQPQRGAGAVSKGGTTKQKVVGMVNSQKVTRQPVHHKVDKGGATKQKVVGVVNKGGRLK